MEDEDFFQWLAVLSWGGISSESGGGSPFTGVQGQSPGMEIWGTKFSV